MLAVLLSLEPGDPASAGPDRWRLFSDRVMGGVSAGDSEITERENRSCLRMHGDVSLENNGGFIQVASDITESERQAFREGNGIELVVYGNGEHYNVHLRTDAMRYPWQSYRASFTAHPRWQTLRLPFASFEPHRIEGKLKPDTVRRIGIVAIGRAFSADLCIGRVSVYGD
jgi:hypothetical protein